MKKREYSPLAFRELLCKGGFVKRKPPNRELPQACLAYSFYSYICSECVSEALTNSRNSGCGRFGREVNSG